MSEIQPALLTRAEIDWLLGKSTNLSKRTERDLRYRINKKVKVFMQTELPLLKDRGFAAALGNGAAAISSGSSTGEYRLVGRGIATSEKHENSRRKRGEWDFRSVLARKFEPTRPFGHGISNPTPYQVAPCSRRSRRPPLVGD